MEYDRGSSLIAFSVEFYGYTRLQNYDFIISVLDLFVMSFLNMHSEYYNEYVAFTNASMAFRVIDFW